MVRHAQAALLGALLFVLGAPAALAATGTVERAGTQIRIVTGDGADELFLRLTADTFEVAEMGVSGAGLASGLDPGPGCVEDVAQIDYKLRCADGNAVTQVILRTAGGNDFLQARSDLDAEIDGDLGTGSDFTEFFQNTRRADLRAGPGTDFLAVGPSSDRLDGGPGSDGFNPGLDQGLGSDEIIGGDGVDEVLYHFRVADLRLSLDGVANDGDATIGEHDNLIGVEAVHSGTGSDVIVGDDGINDFTTSDGDDVIVGGGGFDSMDGGAGNDQLTARDGLAERVFCGDGSDTATVDDTDRATDCETVHSDADLIPDLDLDGIDRPTDCADRDPRVRPGAFDVPENGIDENCDGVDAPVVDRDRDGFAAPADCDDTALAIRPGTVDVPGNAVDENCDGRATPYPRFDASVAIAYRSGRRTRIVGVTAADLDGGERITISCRGDGCPRKPIRRRAGRRADHVTVERGLAGARLAPGAVLSVALRRADDVVKTVRFTMRRGTGPERSTRCRAPDGRTIRC